MSETPKHHIEQDNTEEKPHFIREWRAKRNLTADELGKICGLTGSFISQLERGKSGYTQNSLTCIAKGLEVRPSQVLENPDTQDLMAAAWSSEDNIDPAIWEAIPRQYHAQVVMLYKNVISASKGFAYKTAMDLFAPRPWPTPKNGPPRS